MKSSLEEVQEAMAQYDANGPYDPGARRAALKTLASHGWTEDEYLDACDDDEI